MKVSEVAVNKSVGCRLLNDIRLDTGFLYKGHIVTEEDALMFQISGLKKIRIAELERGDVELRTAQGIIAAKLCGENVAYQLSEAETLKIVSTIDGCFVSDEKRVEKFNSIQKDIILNVTNCYSFVEKGQVIAELDFSLPIFATEALDKIIHSLSGNVPLLTVAEVKPKKVAVVYVQYYNDQAEKKYFTRVLSKLITETKKLDLEFKNEFFAQYSPDSIADSIDDAVRAGADLVLIISGMKSLIENDFLIKGINSTCDDFIVKYVDVAGFADLFVATKRNVKVVSVPFDYDKSNSLFLNELIFKSIIKEKLLPTDFYVRNNILDGEPVKIDFENDENFVKISTEHYGKDGEIAIVILAAGASLRTKKDKLMQEFKGKPLFLNSILVSLESNVGPVFLITGAKHEEMADAVKGLDINIINNTFYREGVRTSVRLGLNHLPSVCKGAIILPADMPHITAEHLNNMIKAFDKEKGQQLIVTSYEGVKYNPTLWSKDLFQYADVVPENSDIRPVFVELEDMTKLVEVNDEAEIFDVTYPADLILLEKEAD